MEIAPLPTIALAKRMFQVIPRVVAAAALAAGCVESAWACDGREASGGGGHAVTFLFAGPSERVGFELKSFGGMRVAGLLPRTGWAEGFARSACVA